MMRFSYATGAAIALLAAGPLFLLLLAVGAGLGERSPFFGGSHQIPQAVVVAFISIPVGMVVGAIPILLGGYGMARLGHSRPATRRPWIWAGAGATIGAAMALAIGPDWRGLLLFANTGALCALIVRYGTRWFDEAA